MPNPARLLSLLLLLLAAAPSAQDATDVGALRVRIGRERDLVDFAVFEELGRRGDEEAYDALKEALGELRSRPALNAACEAFRHFAGTAQERRAIALLAKRARSSDEAERRAAVRGLRLFGDPAREELERIVGTSRHPTTRHLALGGLVTALRTEGTEEALALLLEHYRVPESGPMRLAVSTLAAFDEPWGLALFSERLRDPAYPLLMKRAVVDALATMDTPGVDLLLVEQLQKGALGVLETEPSRQGVYDYSEPGLVVAAIEALARRGYAEHASQLRTLTLAADPAIRRAALVAQGPHREDREDWARRLVGLADDEDPALRQGAARALAELGTPAARGALARFVRDPDESVRFEAYGALGVLRDPRTVPLLLDRLRDEEEHLRWAPYHQLVLLTGEDHGPTDRRWRAWRADAGAGFVPPSRAEALRRAAARREADTAEGRTRVTFYGLPVARDRLCVLVDASVSMKEQTRSGETRQRVAQRELVKLVGHHPLGNRLNLVFFAFDVHPFRTRLVELDEDLRRELLRFVWDQELLPGTSIWEALVAALDDPDVRDIYLLTDGEPTTGKVKSWQGILNEIRRRRRVREFRVHCVDVGGEGRRLLEGLAEVTGGRIVETE